MKHAKDREKADHILKAAENVIKAQALLHQAQEHYYELIESYEKASQPVKTSLEQKAAEAAEILRKDLFTGTGNYRAGSTNSLVMEAMRQAGGTVSLQRLIAATGKPPSYVRGALAYLKRTNRVANVSRGQWVLVSHMKREQK